MLGVISTPLRLERKQVSKGIYRFFKAGTFNIKATRISPFLKTLLTF